MKNNLGHWTVFVPLALAECVREKENCPRALPAENGEKNFDLFRLKTIV